LLFIFPVALFLRVSGILRNLMFKTLSMPGGDGKAGPLPHPVLHPAPVRAPDRAPIFALDPAAPDI
jgi:hypothetical protein